jgi:hypothetical protein
MPSLTDEAIDTTVYFTTNTALYQFCTSNKSGNLRTPLYIYKIQFFVLYHSHRVRSVPQCYELHIFGHTVPEKWISTKANPHANQKSLNQNHRTKLSP